MPFGAGPCSTGARCDAAPDDLCRLVVAIDPPATSTRGADACGIIAAAIDSHNIAYVLKDASVAEVSPTAWATRAISLYHRLEADCILAEVNQGGEMVTHHPWRN